MTGAISMVVPAGMASVVKTPLPRWAVSIMYKIGNIIA
jgi:hypothetical protein